MSCEPQEPRTQETKRLRVGRVPILSSRNRASPTSVLADEKVMPEKEPILALAEEKALREEARRTRHLEEAARALARVRLGRGAGSPGARPGTARESGAAIAARIRALSMG